MDMEKNSNSVNLSYKEEYKSKRIVDWEKHWPEEWREYRRKWVENPKKHDPGQFPIHLDLEATRVCNLKCVMCFRTVKIAAGDEFPEGDMDFSLYKKIVDEGAQNGLYSIKLSYLGEPLVSKDIVRMIKYARSKGILDVMFNTNGVLLTKDMSKKLIEAGATGVFISFDSPFKEHFESIRVGAKFDDVINNVKELVRIREKMGSFFPIVRVSMTVMKENANEIPEFLKLWEPIVDVVGFGQYVDPHHKDKKANDRRAYQLQNQDFFTCPQLYQRLVVHWDGRIGLCCADYDAEMGLGNAKDVSIKSVWLGEKMQHLRRLNEQGLWRKIPLCLKCDLPHSK